MNESDAIGVIFDSVWNPGAHPDGKDEDSLLHLKNKLLELPARSQLSIGELQKMAEEPAIKETVINNSKESIRKGVFGVPTFLVEPGGEKSVNKTASPSENVFWGWDSMDMLGAYLRSDSWFKDGHDKNALASVPSGIQRRR